MIWITLVSNNIINIYSIENLDKVEILDFVGRVVKSQVVSSNLISIETSDLKTNVYFINYTINGVTISKKIIINN